MRRNTRVHHTTKGSISKLLLTEALSEYGDKHGYAKALLLYIGIGIIVIGLLLFVYFILINPQVHIAEQPLINNGDTQMQPIKYVSPSNYRVLEFSLLFDENGAILYDLVVENVGNEIYTNVTYNMTLIENDIPLSDNPIVHYWGADLIWEPGQLLTLHMDDPFAYSGSGENIELDWNITYF